MDLLPHYILAGGHSRRFGSDKARAVCDGQTLIEGVAEGFAPFSSSTHVVAARAGQYADLGLDTFADAVPDAGPLGGLCTLLRHRLATYGAGWAIVSSCDLLEPSPAWLTPLLGVAVRSTSAVAYQNAGGVWQPLPGLYHTDTLPSAESALSAGRAAMWSLLEAVGGLPVPLPGSLDSVPQANTPSQIASGLL